MWFGIEHTITTSRTPIFLGYYRESGISVATISYSRVVVQQEESGATDQGR